MCRLKRFPFSDAHIFEVAKVYFQTMFSTAVSIRSNREGNHPVRTRRINAVMISDLRSLRRLGRVWLPRRFARQERRRWEDSRDRTSSRCHLPFGHLDSISRELPWLGHRQWNDWFSSPTARGFRRVGATTTTKSYAILYQNTFPSSQVPRVNARIRDASSRRDNCGDCVSRDGAEA